MANLIETARWEAGIYQFETSDPVMGGPNGIDNRPTRELANRTLWLKTELAKAVQSIGSNKTAADSALALKANRATQITAGAGLTGGGDLSANRTLALATPSTLSGSTANWAGNGAAGHTHEIAKATPTLAGVVKLVNALNSTATDAALTALQGKVLSEQIAAAVSGSLNMRGALASQNLNDLIGESNYGVWHQSSNANAAAERNYPYQVAGTLFVLPSAYQGVQVYIPFDRHILYIRHSQANGTWSAWRTIGDTVNALNSTSATAALSAAQGKILAERIDGKDSLQTINYADQAALGYHRTGFYRGNGRELDGLAIPPMEMHIAHPAYSNNAYARGIGFGYGGSFNLSTTAWDANGRYLGQKTILTELNGVMLSGDQSIAGTKTFTGSLKSTGAISSGGNIDILQHNKTAGFGSGVNDVFVYNSASNKYLQLKDNGELAYSNDKILLYSDRSDAVNLNRTDKIATSAAVKTAYDKAVAAQTAAEHAVASGTIAFFAGRTAPTGWLKANGAAVSRTTYASLFAAIGTTYGAGNGSNTFNLPDLRGEFVRGFDDGRGVDSGRVLGTWQSDELKSHTHGGVPGRRYDTDRGGNSSAFSVDDIGATEATGGNETRPRNIALLACIKI